MGGSLGGFFWEEFFVYIGIDLFVKILSQGRRKLQVKWNSLTEGIFFQSLEVRAQSHRT